MQLHAESADTRDYVLRTLSARVFDHSPNNGMINAIGPPSRNIGNIAGHKNTNNGYFLVTHTSSTPFSFRISMSLVNFSMVGVILGARVRWMIFLSPLGISAIVVSSHT